MTQPERNSCEVHPGLQQVHWRRCAEACGCRPVCPLTMGRLLQPNGRFSRRACDGVATEALSRGARKDVVSFPPLLSSSHEPSSATSRS